MARILGIALLVGIGGLLISLIVLLILLYRRAILPLDRIQKSIGNYISTKDSKAVVEGLAGIRERNEFGALSDHLSEMVQEIDHYT